MFCRLLIANSVKYRFFVKLIMYHYLFSNSNFSTFSRRLWIFFVAKFPWNQLFDKELYLNLISRKKKKKIKNGVAQSFFINNSYWVNWFHGIFREILVNIYTYVFTTFCCVGYVAFVQIFFIQIIVKLMQLNSSTDFGLIQSFVNFMSFWSSICLK